MKKILITGAGSYIGTSFEKYMEQFGNDYSVDTIDMIGDSWKSVSFSGYGCVFHVAGIAHSDNGKISKEKEKLYYAVNTDLTVETAKKAKADGVKQFIFMSSAIVYGNSAPIGKGKRITKDTPVRPANCYGDSKVQAEKGLRKLEDEKFKVVILRPPMIYGKGSKGNYPLMSKMAQKLPIFPYVKNRRSMLYIDNLCEFVRLMITNSERGTFWPQNKEYSNTSEMVRMIGAAHGKKVHLIKGFTWSLKLLGLVTGIVDKAFGNLYYDKKMSEYKQNYRVAGLKRSVMLTEGFVSVKKKSITNKRLVTLEGKKVLLIALSGYSAGIVKEMESLGACVDWINDKPNDGFVCKTLGRLQFKPYLRVIDKYYYNAIRKRLNKDYDYILVIRGEYTTANALKFLRKTYPNAHMVLYMWDGMHKTNTRGIEKKWPLYDKVFTFDRIDYEANKDRINFLPLYYYNEYLPKDIVPANSKELEYDLSFIGTGHDDRIKIVKSIMKECYKAGKKSFCYFYLPHKLIYIKNKILNKSFKDVKSSDVNYKMLPFESLYDIYSSSKCIIDVENAGQHGLTMRTIEVIGLKRKLITTNKDIVNYDFYNENNILIVDREKPIVDMSFFDKPFIELSSQIYNEYSLKSWIINVLS